MAPDPAVAWSARIPLARCMAEHAIAPLQLCDCGDSIVAVDAASKPALDMLDDAIDRADPAIQAIAEHAEGQLYAGFAVRLLTTLPKLGPDATDSEIALRDMRTQTLQAQLAPWREASLASYQHVVDIFRAHPALANNATVQTAVRDSEQQLAADVADRQRQTPST